MDFNGESQADAEGGDREMYLEEEDQEVMDPIRSDVAPTADLDKFIRDTLLIPLKAPEAEVYEPEICESPKIATSKTYKDDYYPSDLYERYAKGEALPTVPNSVPTRTSESRKVLPGVKNVDGKPLRNVRKEIPWFKKMRIIYRFKELERQIVAYEAFEGNPKLDTTEKSSFILKHLQSWQGAALKMFRDFPIDSVTQVRAWIKASEKPGFDYQAGRLRLRAKKATNYEVIETSLMEWFTEMRADCRLVTWTAFREKANEICKVEKKWCDANNSDAIKCEYVSEGFLNNVVIRHKIVLRAVKRQTTLSLGDVTVKTQQFLTYVQRNLPFVNAVGNFDEMPLSCAGKMGKNKTLAYQSDDLAIAHCDANDTKRFCTIVPVAVAKKTGIENPENPLDGWEGILLTTFVIFIGEPKQGRVLNETYHPGVNVVWSKCGVMTAALMEEKIIPVIRECLTHHGIDSCLMILDSARSHTSSIVISSFWATSIPTAIIPGGMTQFLQYVDVHFAHKYRQKHSKHYEPWVTTKKTSSQKRRLLSIIVAKSVEEAATPLSIVTGFDKLGYLRPRVPVRTADNIMVEPPSPGTLEADEAAHMERREREAAAKRARESDQTLDAHIPEKRGPGRPKGSKTVKPVPKQANLIYNMLHKAAATLSQKPPTVQLDEEEDLFPLQEPMPQTFAPNIRTEPNDDEEDLFAEPLASANSDAEPCGQDFLCQPTLFVGSDVKATAPTEQIEAVVPTTAVTQPVSEDGWSDEDDDVVRRLRFLDDDEYQRAVDELLNEFLNDDDNDNF